VASRKHLFFSVVFPVELSSWQSRGRSFPFWNCKFTLD
jgi:hypothetical protein